MPQSSGEAARARCGAVGPQRIEHEERGRRQAVPSRARLGFEGDGRLPRAHMHGALPPCRCLCTRAPADVSKVRLVLQQHAWPPRGGQAGGRRRKGRPPAAGSASPALHCLLIGAAPGDGLKGACRAGQGRLCERVAGAGWAPCSGAGWKTQLASVQSGHVRDRIAGPCKAPQSSHPLHELGAGATPTRAPQGSPWRPARPLFGRWSARRRCARAVGALHVAPPAGTARGALPAAPGRSQHTAASTSAIERRAWGLSRAWSGRWRLQPGHGAAGRLRGGWRAAQRDMAVRGDAAAAAAADGAQL